jgi:hypothetical protein
MCAAIKSVNPNDKSTSQTGDFALARNELQSAWQSLKKMYENESAPLEAMIDRLQAEQHLEMMRLLARHPQEGTAWEDAYKQCIARQGTAGGGLTLEVTEKYATEAMNMLAQPVRGGSQHNDVRREQKPAIKAEKDVLRGYVERMVNETLRQKRTPGKTRLPRSGGCRRESCISASKERCCRGRTVRALREEACGGVLV